MKLPEVQQHTSGFDCGVYAIANLVDFCSKGPFNFKRKTYFTENYMISLLISCLESGHFTPFPQSTTSDADIVKVYTRKMESIFHCGTPDVFENMLGCEAKRGRVSCHKWAHIGCSGVSGD